MVVRGAKTDATVASECKESIESPGREKIGPSPAEPVRGPVKGAASFTDGRSIGVRKHAVLRTAMSGHDGGGSFLLAGVGPPAFVFAAAVAARVALEVIDNSRNTSRWLRGLSASRASPCPPYPLCFRPLKIMRKILSAARQKFRANHLRHIARDGAHVRCTINSRGGNRRYRNNVAAPAFRHSDSQIQR